MKVGVGLRIALALSVGAMGCGAPEHRESTAPALGPLGEADYAARLAESAGVEVEVTRIVELASSSAERIERRMDRLAAERGEAGGWRPLFARLRDEVPPGEEAVLEVYRAELARAAEFVAERDLVSLPGTRPEVLALENASLRAHFPLALYHDGRLAVTTAGADADGEDAAYLANHCRVCIPPLAVHEGYPGHHVAFARLTGDGESPPSVAELARYKPFVEGWGLYAEVLMLEEGYYSDAQRRLAAWRMVLLRLVRAEIDARLHDGSLESEAAEAIYRERLLLTPAAAAAEVRGHLAKPAVKASYFLGLVQILEARARYRAVAADAPLREFHDRLLGPPESIPWITRRRLDIELGPPGGVELPWPWSSRGALDGPMGEVN